MNISLDSLARALAAPAAPQTPRSAFAEMLARSCRKSYRAGLRGAGGYPLDPAALIAEYEKQGQSLAAARQAAARIIDLVNCAYLAGQQDKEPSEQPAPVMHYQCSRPQKGV